MTTHASTTGSKVVALLAGGALVASGLFAFNATRQQASAQDRHRKTPIDRTVEAALGLILEGVKLLDAFALGEALGQFVFELWSVARLLVVVGHGLSSCRRRFTSSVSTVWLSVAGPGLVFWRIVRAFGRRARRDLTICQTRCRFWLGVWLIVGLMVSSRTS